MEFLGFINEVSAWQATPNEGLKRVETRLITVPTVINTSIHTLPLEIWCMITQHTAVCHLSHLGINDICDVAGSQKWHSNELEHVWQVGLSLFSVVFDPV